MSICAIHGSPMIEIKCYVVGVGIITDTQILLTAPAPFIYRLVTQCITCQFSLIVRQFLIIKHVALLLLLFNRIVNLSISHQHPIIYT